MFECFSQNQVSHNRHALTILLIISTHLEISVKQALDEYEYVNNEIEPENESAKEQENQEHEKSPAPTGPTSSETQLLHQVYYNYHICNW